MKRSLRIFVPVWIAFGFCCVELSMAASAAESSTFMGGQDAFTTVQTEWEPSDISRRSAGSVFQDYLFTVPNQEFSDILQDRPDLQVRRWTVSHDIEEGIAVPNVPFDDARLTADEGFSPSELQTKVLDGVLDEKILTDLQQRLPITLDIQALGYEFPKQPVDLYAAYSDSEFEGIFTKKARKIAERLRTKAYEYVPIVVVWAGTVVSSLNEVLNIALQEVCKSDYRPHQFSIALKAGVEFFASFEGQVTFTFEVDGTCARLDGGS